MMGRSRHLRCRITEIRLFSTSTTSVAATICEDQTMVTGNSLNILIVSNTQVIWLFGGIIDDVSEKRRNRCSTRHHPSFLFHSFNSQRRSSANDEICKMKL